MNPRSSNVLGVILARAGSKGLANKHLQPLLGREVILYTLDHARWSRRLARVVVSTDCPTVRRLAREAGYETVARPPELAGDDASVQDVLLHALDEVEGRGDFHASAVACLYGNVPVRPRDVTDRCIDLLERGGGSSVRTFAPVGKWHPGWMSRLAEDGRVEQFVAGSTHRRQDLEPLFLHDGGGLVMARDSLDAARGRRDDPHAMFGDDRRGLTVPAASVVEIDHETDLLLAEAALRRAGNASSTPRPAPAAAVAGAALSAKAA